MIVEQSVLFKKLFYLLQRSFVDARTLALNRNSAQLADLADTFEIVPALMANWEEGHSALIRDTLTRYQARYPELPVDYLAILDLDDRKFVELYGSLVGLGTVCWS